ncbi:SIR2 family protein [Arthrobacter sp. CAN_C5]|uniref:SIR2 family protein n=1 Tax=Arthrobacter sp. CAN_C5 TaxID=2760706 RepID=UPI001AE2231D|nr:SIR2 family protein [Arthrobacter sp. CAN_C5]MBP2218008.1 ATP-dependent RNA helicase HelY [Arthrobacter sp. CAN_C5]
MTAPDRWIEDIRTRAAEGKVALVCGTGISAAISDNQKFATWASLLIAGFEYLGSIREEWKAQAELYKSQVEGTTDAMTLIIAAQWVQMCFDRLDESGESGEYRSFLRDTVGTLKVNNYAFERVFRSEVPVLTTNYDNLIEQLSDRPPFSWVESARIADYHDRKASSVFHLHGYFENPESVVLSASDYERLRLAKPISQVLQPLATTHTLIMIGYGAGLSDPNFTGFLKWFSSNFGDTVRRIYVLVRERDLPANTLDGKVAYISYGKEHGDLPNKINDLLGLSDPPLVPTPPDSLGLGMKGSSGEGITDGRLPNVVLPDTQPGPLAAFVGLPPIVVNEARNQLGELSELDPFQHSMLGDGATELRGRSSVLAAAVTGTGKTTLARVLMNGAVSRRSSTVMVVPTKALVSQELREWDKWVNAWTLEDRHIRVFGASRDYPENDSLVAKGRFEVALAIYEKLAGYMVAGGTTLSNAELVVVDELQTLVEDRDRAVKLERLLTMIRLIPSEIRPAILGLSATLGAESTDVLRSWLGVHNSGFIQTVDRPVPLDTFVVNETTWRIQRDAHLMALGKVDANRRPEFIEERHDLSKRLDKLDPTKIQVNQLRTAPLAVALVGELLETDPSRRIIVFVPGRTAAQDLAFAIQKMLEAQLSEPIRKGNPWLQGRFATAGYEPQAAAAKFADLKFSDLPLWEQVLRGLRHGVAFHSARLAPRFRRQLEDEFRRPDGLLRVLVATDTIAMGVNLPADAVIATSLSSFGSDRQLRLATPAQLDNKAGRAGRRGLAARDRGEFYIIVPSPNDLDSVTGLTATGKSELSTLAGVYERYVTVDARTPHVVGQIRSLDDIAVLALHVLAADGSSRRAIALEARVESVIGALLAHHEGDEDLPSASEVVARLDGLSLLSEEKGKIRPSILGLALSRSALSLGSADILERLARLALRGAGAIDILFNACRSSEIEGVTAWVGLPSVPRFHYPSLKEAILTYALAYVDGNLTRRQDCARYFGERYALPSQLVADGQLVVSEELKKLLDADTEAIEDRDATALLRAIVAFEWSRGIPFAEIQARFSSAIRSDEQQPRQKSVELKLHYSDVEQLCEQIAGVIRGAVDISFGEKIDLSNRMRMLALQTEVGLPAWLAPIAKMRIECLHRNRLARLWDLPPEAGGWSAVLDMGPLANHEGISERDREAARSQLENRQREQDRSRHRVSQEWSTEFVPGLDGITFDELSDDLEKAGLEQYVDLFRQMAAGLGMKTTESAEVPGFTGLDWSSGVEHLRFLFPQNELGAEEVESVSRTDAIVVLRTRLRPTFYQAAADLEMVARFVAPEALLEIIARLRQARGEALEGEEVVRRIATIRVSAIDGESLVSVMDTTQAPPPFKGAIPPLRDAPSDPTLILNVEDDLP